MREYYSYTPAHRSVQHGRFWAKLAKLIFFAILLLFAGSFIAFPLLALGLPSPDKIVRQEGFSTKIYDRNGESLYDVFVDKKRTAVKLAEIPPYVKQATVAIEDKNFYKHEGFDTSGILRAMLNIATRGKIEGGSTLTQQLVKNVLLSSERTIFRKVREFILAVQIEHKFSKDQILEMYLNEAPYGGTAYGVESAAQTYFGKRVADLTLVEAAILAGLPQRPSVYSPFSSTPKAYIGRAQNVLRRMREDGYITSDQEKEANKELPNVVFANKGAGFKAPHFVTYVQGILEAKYGKEIVENGGLKVTTTLDSKLQEEAQKIVAEEIKKVESLHITNGASVVLDVNTGEILAMVGSKDFQAEDYDGQVNVTLSLRQPGSAIKPVTYLTAFKKGYTPSTMLMDVETVFPGGVGQPDYKPVNYDGKYRGPLQLRYALANSINIVAVKLLSLVGIKDMMKTAYDLGITTLEPTQTNLSRVGLSVTLGGGEVRLLDITRAYTAFANGGKRVEPIAILKVEDKNGKILEETKPTAGKQVITPQQAYLISHILSDNEARVDVFGRASSLVVPGRTVAVKTGTTNDKRDNWTIGWTAGQVAAGVWVGNNDNSPMKNVSSGVTGAAPIWRRIMQAALREKDNTSFIQPEGIVTEDVDGLSGFAAHDGFTARSEIFISGTEPQGDDPIHKKLKICKNEGKIATPSDIASGNYDEKEYFVIREDDPTAALGANRWQEGINLWLTTQADSRYHPPSDYCGSTPINIDFDTPKDNQNLTSNTFEMRVKISSIEKISQVEFELDGQKVATFTSTPFTTTINTTVGTHTLRVKARDQSGRETDRKITVTVGATPTPASL
ncbi:PBP1A family penicillin-binding protein [Candidatus Microgenomates bacterium]|nr:PBP1A family penicillin-binding protein [Candidatus Microgenomates bacterium]